MPVAGDALANQFQRAWEMLRGVVRRVPEDRWHADDDRKLTPARWALHTVETVDSYMGTSMDGYPWGKRFCDWEGGEAEELPTRDELLAYADEVAGKLDERLRGLTEEAAAAESPFHWTGASLLGHWLYVLRHTMHHTGELNMLLRVWGQDEEGEWR